MALTTPSSAASTITCHSWTTLLKVNTARINASSMALDWVIMSKLRRDTRSTITPPQGGMIRGGMAEAKANNPNAHFGCANLYNHQSCPMDCNHVPEMD